MFASRRSLLTASRALSAALTQGCWLSASPSLQKVPKVVPLVGESIAFDPGDPFGLVRSEIDAVSERIRRSIVSEIPALDRASEYFFQVGSEGKRLRPSLILLLASVLSDEPPPVDRGQVDLRPPNTYTPETHRRQQRIAEIAEVIHVASLLHDDVIDTADKRRGKESLNVVVGNKLSVLAGDFLLARVSVTLAALRNTEVVEVISNILENLVTGEVMQMTSSPEELLTMDYYLRKTYRKTGALLANSAKSAAIIAGKSPEVCQAASDYGHNLGMAFQIIDDILDFTGKQDILGKPSLSDLKCGIATAPVLLAVEEFPQLKMLVLRKFRDNGDVQKAVNLVEQSQGIQRARDLAAEHSGRARQAVQMLPKPQNSHATASREALLHLTELVLKRSK